MRLFVGIDMPTGVKDALVRIQTDWIKKGLFEGVMIPYDQMHITLKFLSGVPEGQLEFVDAALKTVVFNQTVATLDGVNLFIDDGVNILYATIECPVLDILVDTLESTLESWCKYDNRPFIAHVSLFRIKHVPNTKKLIDAVQAYSVAPLVFEIQEFQLNQSELHNDGAVHTIIKRYELV